ncbi:MAG: hypothetical protein HYZ72_07090 [Deltaproteobacteria bacterium]|nr:hypothetical protein [Deltaproteobacteria bacterium]
MKTATFRSSLFVLMSVVLIGVAGCVARTPEPQPVATMEKPADSGAQPSPPSVTEPVELETFDAFLDRT